MPRTLEETLERVGADSWSPDEWRSRYKREFERRRAAEAECRRLVKGLREAAELLFASGVRTSTKQAQAVRRLIELGLITEPDRRKWPADAAKFVKAYRATGCAREAFCRVHQETGKAFTTIRENLETWYEELGQSQAYLRRRLPTLPGQQWADDQDSKRRLAVVGPQ
jgi:hypothetical protein